MSTAEQWGAWGSGSYDTGAGGATMGWMVEHYASDTTVAISLEAPDHERYPTEIDSAHGLLLTACVVDGSKAQNGVYIEGTLRPRQSTTVSVMRAIAEVAMGPTPARIRHLEEILNRN